MRLIAINTIVGLKKNSQAPTNAGEIFECDDEQALILIENGAAAEFETIDTDLDDTITSVPET
jgi:hypothetical protein